MKNWYKKSFDLNYLEIYSHRDDRDAARTVKFIEKYLPFQKKDLVLDLCCGNGRHGILLGEKGYRCIGLDLSRKLLKYAQSTAKNLNLDIPLVCSDMRHIPFSNQFDVILNLFTSFGYFESDDENFQVIQSIAESLKRGGYFILDYLNKEYVFNHLVRKSSRILKRGWHLTEERELISERNVIRKRITIFKDDGIDEYFEVLKVYNLEEISGMLKKAEFKIESLFGDFKGNPYNPKSSKRLIIFSRII